MYYYGTVRCASADDAYLEFRAEYHSFIGRDSSRRLDRIGQRKERIHEFGFCRDSAYGGEGFPAKVRYRILGLVGIHYCRVVGIWDIGGLEEEAVEEWIERAFTRGSGMLRLVGKDKSGRTSKRLNTRYR